MLVQSPEPEAHDKELDNPDRIGIWKYSFEETGKPEYLEKNHSEQGSEPATNSTHIIRRVRKSNPGHIGGSRALSPLRNPYAIPAPRIIMGRQAHSGTRTRELVIGGILPG